MIDATEIAILARLIETGSIICGVKNESFIRRLETARWITVGKRKAEWVIRLEYTTSLETRLSSLLPSWRNDFNYLRSISRDPYNPSDIEALSMLRRQTSTSGNMVNRRNWNAAVGLGPKHKAKIPSNGVLTKDWTLRFRPNKGLIGQHEKGIVDLYEMATIWTECVVPERFWMSFTTISGVLPKTIITCENLGAYIDLPVSESTLVIYSPGADIEAAVSLLKMFPAVRWMHFGDLDPEGVDIAKRIAGHLKKEMKLVIPFFAEDYLDAAKPHETTWNDVPDIPLLLALKAKKKRIFQEVFMLDERLLDALKIMHV